jgi:hypothetical protein
MSSPLSSDIPKPFGSSEKVANNVAKSLTPSMPIPAFGDLGKAANDVRSRKIVPTQRGRKLLMQ